jgi:DNA mismatch endonuclease (patch repair protein)
MSRQARAGTAPEMALRRLLHRNGLRYRVGWPVPGRPRRTVDIAFTRPRVAINIHGCFWHGCPEHGTAPQANSAWWKEKLERNRARDEDTRRHLEERGWTLVEVWEHEAPEDAFRRVVTALNAARQGMSKRSP